MDVITYLWRNVNYSMSQGSPGDRELVIMCVSVCFPICSILMRSSHSVDFFSPHIVTHATESQAGYNMQTIVTTI